MRFAESQGEPKSALHRLAADVKTQQQRNKASREKEHLDQVLLDGRLVQPFPERIVVDSCLELLEHLLDRVDQIAILCLLRALFQQIPDENLLILLICDLKGRSV